MRHVAIMIRLFSLVTALVLVVGGMMAPADDPVADKTSFPLTPQVPDALLFEGDTLVINALPLEAYFDQLGERPDEFFPSCISSACGRGYQALWQIEGGYLRSIHSCCNCRTQLPPRAVDTLLAGRLEAGRAFAEWYSGVLPNPQGRRLMYRHIGWGSIYESEVLFHIKNGRLVKRDTVSNVPTRNAQFPGGLDSLQAFVYWHLDWDVIPRLDTTVTVISSVTIDTTGQVEVENVYRAKYPETEAAIRRVMEQLPRWEIGYYKGQKISMGYGFPIPLNESVRQRYAR